MTNSKNKQKPFAQLKKINEVENLKASEKRKIRPKKK